jgi:hypothetical protein
MPSTTQKTNGFPFSTQKNRQLIFVSKNLSHEQSVQRILTYVVTINVCKYIHQTQHFKEIRRYHISEVKLKHNSFLVF